MAAVQHATDAPASEQVARDPTAPKCVSSGSSACSQGVGDRAAGLSQGPSDGPANSEGTTVTPPNHDDPAKFLRGLTTPAGFRLGANEGWKSSGSSVVRYQPNTSSASSPRRDNPKSSGLRSNLAIPTPKRTPEYETVAEYQSLKLCRVSDAVPYLLGPRTLVERIHVILEHGLRFTADISLIEIHLYSNRDRALMAIMSSLQTPEFNRRERGNWYPQGLAAKNGRLRLYKHTSPGSIEITHVKLSRFIEMAQAWHLMPNPALFASDHPDAKTSWADTAPKLRAQGVDLFKIDQELYYDLTMRCSAIELPDKLEEVVQWSQDGTLDQRYTTWSQQAARSAAASRVTTITEKGRPDGLYTKRYTHRHPLGRPRSIVDDIEKAERRANKASRGQTEKEDGKVKGWWAKRRERRRSCYFALFMSCLFGSIIGSMVWAMANSSWDFTPAGATG